MIRFDKKGYPVSKDDSMDSAVRAGVLVMTGSYNYLLQHYINDNGIMVRHPFDDPSNNYKNCTRDQMLPLVAGYYASPLEKEIYTKKLKAFFWERLTSLFFMQNTQRDKRGSKKSIFPHSFYKDSNPVTDTKTIFNNVKLDPSVGIIESKNFDFCDPLLPNHIWFLIKAAKMYWFYPFALIGIPFFILTLIAHSIGNHNEENQMIAECYVNGTWALHLYKLINRRWKARSLKYWEERDEVEYHEAIVEMLEDL